MLRRPPSAIATSTDDRVHTLDDGFERLGDTDTPFTLRGGIDKRKQASRVHKQRDTDVRQFDESTHEPVTRDLAEWMNDMLSYDFIHVDTIPLATQFERAKRVANVAKQHGLIGQIDYDVTFRDETLRGRFWPDDQHIELGTQSDDFPGYCRGAALVHEVSHGVYKAWTSHAGFDHGKAVFTTETQTEQACLLSERLYGPFVEPDGPFIDYRKRDEELFAAVFTARIIEPISAKRLASVAIDRVEDVVSEIVPDLF
jgi:hypothetical protein